MLSLSVKYMSLIRMKVVGIHQFLGYRPQFYFRTTDITGTVVLDEGVEMVMPGDNTRFTAELIHLC